MPKQVYTIYSHEDADGGISAAIYARHILDHYQKYGWEVEIVPVNHFPSESDWSYQQIACPSAILDFSLHAQFLNQRFFSRQQSWQKKLGGTGKVPPCAWIDHHPTGATFDFLNAANVQASIPDAKILWDTNAISTPGLFRTHHEDLGIAKALLEEYEEYIDLAEIVDGALYASPEAAHDFTSMSVKIQTLFSVSHPAINIFSLYKKIVGDILADANPENLLDKDPLYPALVQYEENLHNQRLHAYAKATKRFGKVAVANFLDGVPFAGLSRFLPYVLFPDVEYAVHVLPKNRTYAPISAGINPWNKPESHQKHLGNFFAQHFNGGGHSFVAGGKVSEDETKLIDTLVDFLQ